MGYIRADNADNEKFMRKYCDIIEKIFNIEPKLVVKLQPFGTERVIRTREAGYPQAPPSIYNM